VFVMKVQNAFLGFAASVALALAATGATAGTVIATAPVSVTILAPVTVAAVQGLDFGVVTRPANANSNTISMDPSGNVTVTGSGDGTHVAGGVTAAKFNIVGDAGITYSTTQSLTFGQTGLTNITASSPVATNGSLGVIPASGSQEIRLGGAFDVSAASPIQSYSGALTVTVNYN
jgi:hypothetical protein